MANIQKCILEFFTALTFFCGILLIIRFSGTDLLVSDRAYNSNAFYASSILKGAAFIGKYLAVIFCGLLILLIPFLLKKKNPLVREAFLALCLLLIGPGILNNFVFKPLFQRPRPVQVDRYNKNSEIKFSPALSRGNKEGDTSFPSGHAGAAFFFIFPWFCLRFRKEFGIKLIIPGLVFGLITGSVRILEGRHFLSDIIASLALVYLTGTILSYFFYKNTQPSQAEAKV